jgi:thiol:disulfide interchange protein
MFHASQDPQLLSKSSASNCLARLTLLTRRFDRKRIQHALAAFAFALLSLPTIVPTSAVHAQFADSSSRVKVSVVPSKNKVAPGSDIPIAVIFDHRKNWHIHLNDPKDIPAFMGGREFIKETIIKAEVISGNGASLNTAFVQWPKAHETNVGSKAKPIPYSVFKGKAIAYIPITIANDATPGKVKIAIKVSYQACGRNNALAAREVCLPPVDDELHEFEIEIVSRQALAGVKQVVDDESFAEFDPTIWQRIRGGEKAPEKVKFPFFGWSFELDVSGSAGIILLMLVAAGGGLMLNFTPCVLPVIPIKIMSLSQTAGNRGKCFMLGAVMSLGVVAFWLVLGAAIALISDFTATNQLFQKPWFTIGIGVIIAIMAIGMCGLFSLKLPSFMYAVNVKHDSIIGSFFFGVMTAILSTPCTAPFMGSAAAWAATQSPVITMTTFAAIGAGMAIPYLILSAWPKLVQKMPRTGPASDLIKHVMGLFMLAAAAYFVGVGISAIMQTPPDPPSRAYWIVVMLLIGIAGAWMAIKTVRISKKTLNRITFAGLGVVLFASAIYGSFVLTDKGRIDWQYYTPERFEQAQKEGKVVVLEFTAEWCLNCKWLEANMLQTDAVVQATEAENVVPMKVDLTGGYELGNAKLIETGSRTIPWLVIYAPDNTQTLRSDAYTSQQVVDAIKKALEKTSP